MATFSPKPSSTRITSRPPSIKLARIQTSTPALLLDTRPPSCYSRLSSHRLSSHQHKCVPFAVPPPFTSTLAQAVGTSACLPRSGKWNAQGTLRTAVRVSSFRRPERKPPGRTSQICSVVEDRPATDGGVQIDVDGAGSARSGDAEAPPSPESSALVNLGLFL